MARLASRASSLLSSFVLLLLLLPLFASPLASAAQISWLSPSVGGSWHDAANWDLNRVPAADGTHPMHLWVRTGRFMWMSSSVTAPHRKAYGAAQLRLPLPHSTLFVI